jgi:hypothetical protein
LAQSDRTGPVRAAAMTRSDSAPEGVSVPEPAPAPAMASRMELISTSILEDALRRVRWVSGVRIKTP